MLDKTVVLTTLATLAIAAATGHLMQNSDNVAQRWNGAQEKAETVFPAPSRAAHTTTPSTHLRLPALPQRPVPQDAATPVEARPQIRTCLMPGAQGPACQTE